MTWLVGGGRTTNHLTRSPKALHVFTVECGSGDTDRHQSVFADRLRILHHHDDHLGITDQRRQPSSSSSNPTIQYRPPPPPRHRPPPSIFPDLPPPPTDTEIREMRKGWLTVMPPDQQEANKRQKRYPSPPPSTGSADGSPRVDPEGWYCVRPYNREHKADKVERAVWACQPGSTNGLVIHQDFPKPYPNGGLCYEQGSSLLVPWHRRMLSRRRQGGDAIQTTSTTRHIHPLATMVTYHICYPAF